MECYLAIKNDNYVDSSNYLPTHGNTQSDMRNNKEIQA